MKRALERFDGKQPVSLAGKVFVSNPAVSQMSKISLIGINHGHWIFPKGWKTGRLVEKIIREGKPKVLWAEKASINFLPRKNIKQSIEMCADSAVLNYLISQISEKKISMARIPALKNFFSEFFRKVELVKGTAPKHVLDRKALERKDLKKIISYLGITPKKFAESVELIFRVRSLIMAGMIMSSVQAGLITKKRIDIAAVIGSGHHFDVHNFLENPKLAIKYADLVLRKLDKTNRHYWELKSQIEDVKRYFNRVMELSSGERNA